MAPVGEAQRRLGVFLAEALQEMLDQQGNIFLAIAQRGKLDGNHIQAVIQILAEAAFAHQAQQIQIAGGDDAHIHFDVFPCRPGA